MIRADVLWIMEELGDFTNAELGQALEMSSAGVAKLLAVYESKKYVERVKIGHYTLNSLTKKAERVLSQTPLIDPEERLLPVSFEGIVPVNTVDCADCGKMLSWELVERGETLCNECWFDRKFPL